MTSFCECELCQKIKRDVEKRKNAVCPYCNERHDSKIDCGHKNKKEKKMNKFDTEKELLTLLKEIDLNISKKNLSNDEEKTIFINSLDKYRTQARKTVMEISMLKIETPLEYAIVAFIEIFECILTSNPKDQIDILKGFVKFLEIIPEPSKLEDKFRSLYKKTGVNNGTTK